MRVLSESRRLRLRRVKTADGLVLVEPGADVWQDENGDLKTSGIWSGLLPYSPQDVKIQAARLGISPLEWMRLRMLNSSLVQVEVIE